jgi:putative protein-disulfide isomerase
MYNKRFNYQPGSEKLFFEDSLFYESSLKSLDKYKVNIVYYTDPLCCACWAMEPVIRKLVEEYGDYFNLILKMGGLLEDWSYVSDSDFSTPEEMESHWKEVGSMYGMPISGAVWRDDPLHSSYPPSRAYIAAKKQGAELANLFFRKLREALFIYDRNICLEENLLEIASISGLDEARFLADYRSVKTKDALLSEISEARAMGVNFFPTLVFIGDDDCSHTISGVRPYETYVFLLKEIMGYLPEKKRLHYSLEELFEKYELLSLKEITSLTDLPMQTVMSELGDLVVRQSIDPIKVHSSFYWKKVRFDRKQF